MTSGGESSSVRWGTTEIAYAIRRSDRRSTVSISVDSSGRVVLTAPATRERLDRLVHVKAPWIVVRVRSSRELSSPSPREMVSGETFLYLGRQHRLRLDFEQSQIRPLVVHDGKMHVRAPRGLPLARRADYVRASLVDWRTARSTHAGCARASSGCSATKGCDGAPRRSEPRFETRTAPARQRSRSKPSRERARRLARRRDLGGPKP